MAAMSNYLENKIIDWLLRGQSYTPPATTYIALFTVAPTQAGGGTEVSGGSYARVAVTSGATEWTNTQNSGSGASTGTSGTTSNASTITFPTATASWGTVVAVGFFDASTSGNQLLSGNLTTSQVVNNGGVFSFGAGTLSEQIDN